MKYQIDHDYHIHSVISLCSGQEAQTPSRILQYAKDNGLKKIILTDHYWDESIPDAIPFYREQGYARIERSLPLPTAEGIEFLFGCETELDMNLRIGVPTEKLDLFSFVIIPFSHFHIGGFVLKTEEMKNPERLAELWLSRIEAIVNMSLPFGKVGIAHPICGMKGNAEDGTYLEPLRALYKHSDKLREIFTRVAKVGVGLEINQYDVSGDESELEMILPLYRMAKECGCKFYLGSDAHGPDTFAKTRAIFERFVDLLGLTEEDKFHIHA